jgi:hypothetical protein
MPRSVVGLLAAVGAALFALVGFSHGHLAWVMIGDASVATGLASYLALPSTKKVLDVRFTPDPVQLNGSYAVSLAMYESASSRSGGSFPF